MSSMPAASQARPFGVAFLLAQVGGEVARRYAERVGPLGLTPSHAGCLRILVTSGPMNQKELARRLGAAPSRVVVLIDALTRMGLVERCRGETDRRIWNLVCTPRAHEVYQQLRTTAARHEEEFTSMLSAEETSVLTDLLRRIAERRGLLPGVHPDLTTARAERPQDAKQDAKAEGSLGGRRKAAHPVPSD